MKVRPRYPGIRVTANGNQLVYGSDRWTGASVNDHPDFAWYPTLRAQDNPQLDYNLVNQLNQQAQ